MQCLVPETEPKKTHFYSYISRQSIKIFKLIFDDYDAVDYDDLLECLHRYELKTPPNCDNIKPIILEITHTVIVQKPKYASCCLGDLHLSEENVDENYRTLFFHSTKRHQPLKRKEKKCI